MAEDLTGRRFGRLVVVSRAPNGKIGEQDGIVCAIVETVVLFVLLT